MDYRKTCFSCMEELSKIDSICEHCGYDNQIRSNGIGYLAGGLLGNQYIVGKALGRGGFGITYLGYDTGLQRKVAIKEYFPSDLCIRDPNTQDLHSLDKESDNAFEKGKQRALREARLTARIDNIPNVVRTYGVLEAHNTVYIIMEYIDGMTLSRFAQQQSGKLSWIRAWALIKPIMMTLGEVHKRGVVHKDISPENIMIRYSDGMPVLLDFGAAQNATTGNTEHSVNINAGYAPLEAFSTMGVQDGRTDEYSLMATLYYLLTGKKPASPLNVLSGIENVVPPSRLGADISSETEAVLLKGMSVRIEERYATMGELAEAFEKAGRTAGTIAYSDEQLKDIASKGVQNQSDKKRGTNKQRIIVPIVVILIALAVFVLFMLNGGKNKDVQSSQITLNTVEPTPALTPTPEPTPELTPEPTPEPTPELTPEQTPEPTPELTLEPTLEPTLQVDVTFEGENKLSELEVGSYITFGSYEQDNDFSNGKESIEWLVLDYDVVNNRALLLSRYGLDAKPYNSSFSKVTWETCTLRSWLNEEFLNEAFSTKERSSILMTSVDNSFAQVYSEFRSSGGNNTQDRIFLLSCAEANKYLNVTDMGENNTKSRMAPTAYAIKEGASTDSNYETNDGGVTGWWWLRSPGRSQRYAASVSRGGSLLYSGVSLGSGCVRPALWVNLDSLDQEQTSKLIDVTEIAAESTPTPTLTSIKTISSEQELLDYFPQITKVTRESGMFIDEIRIEFNQKIAVAKDGVMLEMPENESYKASRIEDDTILFEIYHINSKEFPQDGMRVTISEEDGNGLFSFDLSIGSEFTSMLMNTYDIDYYFTNQKADRQIRVKGKEGLDGVWYINDVLYGIGLRVNMDVWTHWDDLYHLAAVWAGFSDDKDLTITHVDIYDNENETDIVDVLSPNLGDGNMDKFDSVLAAMKGIKWKNGGMLIHN